MVGWGGAGEGVGEGGVCCERGAGEGRMGRGAEE